MKTLDKIALATMCISQDAVLRLAHRGKFVCPYQPINLEEERICKHQGTLYLQLERGKKSFYYWECNFKNGNKDL